MIEYAVARVGSLPLPIGVEPRHVSLAEVGGEVFFGLWGNAQRERVISFAAFALGFLYHPEPCVYGACFPLLVQWHAPQVGGAVGHAFLSAHFAHDFFPDDACHHAAEVGSFQWRGLLEWDGDAFHFWYLVSQDKGVPFACHVERVAVEVGQFLGESALGDVEQFAYHLVAIGHGFQEKLLIVGNRQQSLFWGKPGVKQADVYRAGWHVEVIA